jgi:peptide-methionine (R)-S-oxide reductase
MTHDTSHLTPEQYDVTQCSATEPPFTGAYWDCHDEGMYRCVVCQTPLFDSAHKFDSGTGWPSFDRPVEGANVRTSEDTTLGMRRIEVSCATCGAHLGHQFPDGPYQTTGQRFCINSAALHLQRRGKPSEA